LSEARKKLPKFVSPKGPFRFPKLVEPDYGNEKYPKPDGEYSVQQVFKADSKEAKQLIKDLTPLYKEAIAEAAEKFKAMSVAARKKLERQGVKGPIENPLFNEIYDKETEEPTGEITFKFAGRASGERKKGPKAGTRWNWKPTIFDAKGKRIDKAPDIWGGTIGKVAFEAEPYFIEGSGAAGLKLKLLSVQIIDLVSGGSRSAADFGFEEEEGYAHEDAPDEETFPEGDADDDSDDDGSANF
jgi:hypothetical protein